LLKSLAALGSLLSIHAILAKSELDVHMKILPVWAKTTFKSSLNGNKSPNMITDSVNHLADLQ